MENKKKGITKINYMPKKNNIVLIDNEQIVASAEKSGLILGNQIPDSTFQNLGLATKAAQLSNKQSEEMELFEVVSIGPDVVNVSIGETILCSPGCRALSIKVEGKFYLQVGEHDVEGSFGKYA